jgi:nucleoid-associated protein YgaU
MTAVIALQNASSGELASPSSSGGAARQQLEKASLDVYEAVPRDNGGADIGAARGSVTFQFNPKELTIQKSAKWERKPAKGSKTAGPPEFTGAEPCKLTVEVFFDATGKDAGGVVPAVEQLFACCVPTAETVGKKKAMPNLVIFHWGRTTSFPGFITQVSAKYTLFSPDGTPIRAVCSVSIEEMPAGQPRQNPTSGVIAVSRSHVMVAGDSLPSVAYAEYGEATMWRLLADYNGIDDPLRVPKGATLLLPAADQLLAAGGR